MWVVLSYSRTSTATSASKPSLTTSGKPTPTTAEDFGWKDPSKKGKKAAAAQAAYQPSEEAVARFEKRQAEREKALVKLAKVCFRPILACPRWLTPFPPHRSNTANASSRNLLAEWNV